jgi:ABC-type bacteriocin/lantibiotic exporter with double-glycine peptidase domain
MLVLDEATSALDSTAEAFLLTNLRRAASGRTVIVVTHRPTVLHVCDRVVLLRRGKVAHAGSPEEVLALMRLPAPLMNLQAAG